jgi:hypothetical protein
MPSSSAPAPIQAADLPEWRAVSDAPGIAELAPDLSGLTVRSRRDLPALVQGGDAIRQTIVVLSTPDEAAEALKRASGDDYAAALERAFRGQVTGPEPGGGWRLEVPRPAESGTDTVELLVRRRGRTLALVELVSARGFDTDLRARIIARASR